MATSVSSALDSSQITSLIQQASTAYQAPASALQAQEQPIQAQISALGKVQGALSSLQSALAALADVSSLAQRTVNASPSGVVSATVTNDASPGTYDLTGIHLAQAQSLISSGFASASATLGSGSITIQVDRGSATTVAVASGQSSLVGIANAIDQANAGVEASVLYDGSSYHLVLSGDATGTANAFTVSGAGGLSGLSYHPGASDFSETEKAADAAFSLNGIAITSGSNTISRVVPGLTLTLAASGSATVQVSGSATALDQSANKLVSALNNVLDTVNQYASYSPASGAGPLFADVGLQVLRASLLDAIASPASGGTAPNDPYNSLGAAGFSITSGGTVALDDASFQTAAQADYGAVAALVQSLYGNMSSVVNSALASGTGSVTSEIAGLNSSISSMNQQIAALQQQAQQETAALTQQYSAAEATMSQLETVSNFLTTYFNLSSGGSGG